MNANGEEMKAVYTVMDRGAGKSRWTRIGVGFVNRDGSINLKLDALPINGTLQIRAWEEREWAPRAADGQPPASMPRGRPQGGVANTSGAGRNPNDASGGLA